MPCGRTRTTRSKSPTSRAGRRPTAVSQRAPWSSCAPTGRSAGLTRLSRPSSSFRGVSLAALKFLHLERKILFHGHEPLDTDSTPTLEGEHWLMHNGYAQARASPISTSARGRRPCRDRLSEVRRRYRRLRALRRHLPADWPHGARDRPADAPLPRSDTPLRFDPAAGMRIRDRPPPPSGGSVRSRGRTRGPQSTRDAGGTPLNGGSRSDSAFAARPPDDGIRRSGL